MSKLPLLALVGLLIACTVSILFVMLLPSPVPKTTYHYTLSDDGIITWLLGNSYDGTEKLRITSDLLKMPGSQINKVIPTPCGNSSVTIEDFHEVTTAGNSQCWLVRSLRTSSVECKLEATDRVRDCIMMKTSRGKTVHWFGGAEMISQKWPINEINIKNPKPFLSSDLPKRYGNVLERYYLSSLGSAIYAYPDVPLYVSMIANEQICLEATYNESQRIGPSYLKPDETASVNTLSLDYLVCISDAAKDVHQIVTNPRNGLIKRPDIHPDLRMMKDPIWSTWARYKARINQTVVEQFAEEILAHNFTNSQLEIDDGYEAKYGDFTFDENKFPDASGMIEGLRAKGFRVTTWVTPFINLDSKNYVTARKNNFFVQEGDGSPGVIRWWNGKGSLVDFTNPNAVSWYRDLLGEARLKYSLDSFKFDAGETSYLPQSGLEFTYQRRTNPGDYTTAYANAAFSIGGNMAEMRSSWKTQNTSFFMRLMDKGSTWGSLRGFQTVIPTALTFSILGYPFILPDMIGGNAYVFGRNDSKAERELYIRWIELGAFLPCMQFSISPWQYDNEVTAIARRYVDLHRTIVYEELVKSATRYIEGDAVLLIAPVWFYFSDNEEPFSIDDEFVVGDKYLVAPIIEKGETERDIYLPGDARVRWRDKMRKECGEDELDCIRFGGSWIRSYKVSLEEISWWERLEE